MKVDIVSSIPHEEGYYVGELMVLLLRGQYLESEESSSSSSSNNNNSENPSSTLIAFAQLHGHLTVDNKWAKTSLRMDEIVIEGKEELPIDRPYNLPVDPKENTSLCLLTSSKIPISPFHLLQSGIIIEAMLPIHTLPSCRGKISSVSYYLSIVLQTATWSRTLHFPITLHGPGSSTIPMTRQYVGLAAYPLASMPRELFMEPFLGRPITSLQLGQQSYKISDKGHICNAHIQGNRLLLGGTIRIDLDFTQSEQSCRAVRATLLQVEARNDVEKTVIQEKIIGNSIKYTEDALKVIFSLPLPSEIGCTMVLPLSQVQCIYYQLGAVIVVFHFC